jgi:uncharacterized Zn finger protein
MPASNRRDSAAVRSSCPDCKAGLKVLRIIPGREGCEYWTMRCTRCGGIHLDTVNAPPSAAIDTPARAVIEPARSPQMHE